MELLRNPVQGYAWGSRSVIAGVQGRAVPSPGPEAELWIGAHPAASSAVDRPGGPVSLVDVVSAQPEAVLGEEAAGRFGPRLPYLLKLLAAEEPLSLQAHPDAAAARVGYAAERAAGVDPAARNYADPHHKPELLVAVSPFEALCGFRAPEASAALLDGLGVAALDPVVAALRAGPRGLRTAVERLLTWPSGERADLVEAVLKAADPTRFGVAVRLARHYPGDTGVVLALLLNHVTLSPGEAIWMPAGNLHAYLHGTGVEIMAASDNVLRGGLTVKRVDAAELLRVLRYEPLADPVLRPVELAPGVSTWPAPVEEFVLYGVQLAGGAAVELPARGPRTVFCLRGAVLADDGRAAVPLRPGQAAFGAAAGDPLRLAGTGQAFVAALPSG